MEGQCSLAEKAKTLLIDKIDTKVLQKNVEQVLAILNQNRYQNFLSAKLIAVTKTVSASVIEGLNPLGILDIGENRVQVALPKLTQIAPEFHLHWIGRLQSNKVKDIIEHVDLLHSMDRLSLAQETDRQAGIRGRNVPVLVQVNIAKESQKAGLDVTEIRPFLDQIRKMPNISVKGLMAMMPLGAEEALLTGWFREMRKLFDALKETALSGVEMEELSMGMSNDYAIAAREGATMVRVGTALFRA